VGDSEGIKSAEGGRRKGQEQVDRWLKIKRSRSVGRGRNNLGEVRTAASGRHNGDGSFTLRLGRIEGSRYFKEAGIRNN